MIQVTKVWWDGEKLMAEPIDPATMYEDNEVAQPDSTCNKTLRAEGKGYPRTCRKCGKGPCIADRVQPKQEPMAHTTGHCENHKQKGGCQLHNLQCGWPDCDLKPITTPAQRTWVGLTDEEIDKTHETEVWDARRSYARAIEAKLKEKNT